MNLLAPILTDQHGQDLYNWVSRTISRFPKWIDFRLAKGLHAILGPGVASCFLEERSLPHLKRLLLAQFLLQKKIEQCFNQQQDQLFIKIFSVDAILCVAVVCSKKDNALTDQNILEAAGQKIPALRKIDSSCYQWENRALHYTFRYLELEKMRGKNLFIREVKVLESYLQIELRHYLTEASVFWPYNYEEAFKQLLILAKEVSSKTDYPQVSIHFQKQTTQQLEFIIYLARSKASVCPETTITEDRFPLSTQLVTHLRQEIDSDVPKLIEAFSLFISSAPYKKYSSINLLHAREFIFKLIENAIGTFRDYNGGLFEAQEARFRELSRLFCDKTPNFSLFAKKLFYSLSPIEEQISLKDEIFGEIFQAFSLSLLNKSQGIIDCNEKIIVFKFSNSKNLAPYFKIIELYKKRNIIKAYSTLEIQPNRYIIIFSEEVGLIKKIKNQLITLNEKEFKLSIDLQKDFISSFHPFYLGKELRGHSISKLLFEGLMRLNSKGKVECAGCRKVEISRNEKVYRFILREHCWSDGKPVTAFQYEESWKAYFHQTGKLNFFAYIKNSNLIRKGKRSIKELGVKALNSSTLEVSLSSKDPFFLERLTYPIFAPAPNGFAEPNVFNGPYVLKKSKKNLILLEKNPYFWNYKSQGFLQIEFQILSSQQRSLKNFLEGSNLWLGAPFNLDSLGIPTHLGVTLKAKKEEKALLIFCNTKQMLLSSRLVRKALSLCIDRQFIAREIYPNTFPMIDFLLQQASTIDAADAKQNVGKARKIFQQGLRKLNISNVTSFPITILIDKDSPQKESLAMYLRESWSKHLGVKVHVTKSSWNSVMQRTENENFQIVVFSKSIAHPFFFLEEFDCSDNNYSQWTNPTYSRALKQARLFMNTAQGEALLNQAKELLSLHMPVIPLVARSHFYAHHPSLKGYVFDCDGGVDLSSARLGKVSSK